MLLLLLNTSSSSTNYTGPNEKLMKGAPVSVAGEVEDSRMRRQGDECEVGTAVLVQRMCGLL